LKLQKKLLRGTAAVMLALVLAPAAMAQGAPRELVPMGCAVGIQMNTNGILVVGLTVDETSGTVSPAGDAGILPGDLIVKLGAVDVTTAADFMAAVETLDGEDISITVRRGERLIQYTVKPEVGEDGACRLGVWLRDGVSGIGTITFYDPETGVYGALGHAINDMDTGLIMPLGKGSIMEATVVDVKRGAAGCPGELCGCYDAEKCKGSILLNTACGIYGIMSAAAPADAQALPVAGEDEIVLGKATILSNVSGQDIQAYEVEITRVYRNDGSGRSMMISVTDPDLLAATGGIVQGMSGSPIIQNGKLVGAVTHVLVNDPTRGYGISISRMLEQADGVPAMENAA
jgi:stage IV sporulation protein B